MRESNHSGGESAPSKKGSQEEKPDSSEQALRDAERSYLEKAWAAEEARRAKKAGQAGDEARPPEGAGALSDGMKGPRDLCGLALSGGGIRSATFNLGLLQGLHQMGLLGVFDYLATVSGGGYIGGFWTAWQHHDKLREKSGGPPTGERKLFPEDRKEPEGDQRTKQTQGNMTARGANLTHVRHLREFSNFLTPRLGLLSADTGRLIVAALGAVIPALLAALSLIVLALLLWGLLTVWLISPGELPESFYEYFIVLHEFFASL